MMQKAILLVEDNPYDQELTLLALKSAGLLDETVVAGSGEEALNYLFCRGTYATRLQVNPAFVLLDLHMPGVDGIHVLQAVRSAPSTARVPIVVLSGSLSESDISRSYENGANAFVVRPDEFHELVTAVAQIGMFWVALNEPPAGSVKCYQKQSSHTHRG